MASIKDVAKYAGLGAATVSRYLNDGYVSDESAEKIKKAIKELNYTPNELARNLYRKKSGIVAILIPDIAHPFFGEFVRYAEQELYYKGYKALICNTINGHKNEEQYIDMLNRHIVDGIITGVHTVDAKYYLNTNKPVVALDRNFGGAIPDVHVDHFKGGELAGKCFLRAGCKNVLQFQGAKQVQSSAHLRHDAIRAILESNQVKLTTCELEWNRFSQDYFKQVVEKELDKNPGIDGVFGTDLIALACLQILHKQGKVVPDDVKVIAYDGTYVTKLAIPQLTTINQPIQVLAKKSVECLINRIDGVKIKNTKIMLEVEIEENESTRVM